MYRDTYTVPSTVRERAGPEMQVEAKTYSSPVQDLLQSFDNSEYLLMIDFIYISF